MNKVILIGNLTKDPELTTTTNGISVCKFTLAINRKYTNAEGEREADYINIVTWRALAENAHKYLRKGKKAGIVGELVTRNYEAEDGTRRYVTEVNASEVEFLSPAGAGTETNNTQEPPALEAIDDSDLPF